MRSSIFVLFFVFFQQIWSQEIAPSIQDSLSVNANIFTLEKDSIQALPAANKNITLDSLGLLKKNKKLPPEKAQKRKVHSLCKING